MKNHISTYLLVAAACAVSATGCKDTTKPSPAGASSASPAGASPAGASSGDPAPKNASAAKVPAGEQAGDQPSSGKELAKGGPQITVESARAAFAEALKAAADKTPDCKKVLGLLNVNLAVLNPKITPDMTPAFTTFAECAEREKAWIMLNNIAARMNTAVPTWDRRAFLPHSLIKLDDLKTAQSVLDGFRKAGSAGAKDPEVAVVAAELQCKLKKWNACLKETSTALGLPASPNPKVAIRVKIIGNAVKAVALHFLGKFDQSNKALDAADAVAKTDAFGSIRKRNAAARISKVVVDGDINDDVFLGLYHLYGRDVPSMGALAPMTIYNFTGKDLPLQVEVELPGITERSSKSVMVLKGKSEVVNVTPPLKVGFDVGSLRAPQSSAVKFKVARQDGSKVYVEDEDTVQVYPRDYLPRALKKGSDRLVDVRFLGAAWVTPNVKSVDAFLTRAKAPLKNMTLSGTQAVTLPQVTALWNELKAEKVSYVMDPSTGSDLGVVQRTRLPADVLESKNAQCLEGSLAFATLFEAIGLDPILINVPGHAFVGYLASSFDMKDPEAQKFMVKTPFGPALIVETTMVAGADAPTAIGRGKQEYEENVNKGNFQNGNAGQYLLSALRAKKITPQPTQ